MFTSPMSLSKTAYKTLRRQLKELVEKAAEEVPMLGDAEEVACLNIDLFKVLR